MGDVLLTTGIISAYKSKHPDHQIFMHTRYPEVISRMEEIEGFCDNKEKLYEYCDRVFDLDLCYEKKPKMHILNAYSEHVFQTQLFEVVQPKLKSTMEDKMKVEAFLNKHHIDMKKPCIIIHALKSHANRTLPIETWNEVTDKLIARGYHVFLIGKENDLVPDNEKIFNMLGQFSIFELRELIKKAKAFICCDSGPMHIAQTTETPIIAIFSVANPLYRIWRNSGNGFSAVYAREGCIFCLERIAPPVIMSDCKDPICLKSITSKDILGW